MPNVTTYAICPAHDNRIVAILCKFDIGEIEKIDITAAYHNLTRNLAAVVMAAAVAQEAAERAVPPDGRPLDQRPRGHGLGGDLVKVKITYFKESGKYYTDAVGETVSDDYWDAMAEVRGWYATGDLPGLEMGVWSHIAHVEPVDGGIPMVIGPSPIEEEGTHEQ